MLRLGDTIYAEITTYGNIGSTLRQTPGMHVVRTVPFSVPNRFYNPKYTVKEVQPYESFSPLIFWEPWVITSKDGKATVTFHHKNEPGNYTLILEGSDMNGNLGYVRHKFVIKE